RVRGGSLRGATARDTQRHRGTEVTHLDNVCHTLVGAAFGEAGLKYRTRFGAAALMVSANIPDVDVLVFATGSPPVAFRRGITHGIVAQLLLPIALTGIFMVLARLRPPRPDDDRPPLKPA